MGLTEYLRQGFGMRCWQSHAHYSHFVNRAQFVTLVNTMLLQSVLVVCIRRMQSLAALQGQRLSCLWLLLDICRDDLEIEVDRFDLELGEALKKFEFEKRPRPPLEETLPIGVDAFSRLLGRTEDQSLEEATEKLLARILRSIFPEASLADIEQVFRERPSRVGLYS
ncbi:unnamed protein product [Ostreobium quekettii]|uniref:Uncharacterized protein n=1 Tax=Ostreobium quekettii TaxID=121088 RepID=A0A8S1J3H1_9CHLO|nr:unnamed protein product [Ostreobium quekettii]